MPKLLTGIFLLFIIGNATKAQINNYVFEDKPGINEGDSGNLYLGIVSTSFFKNNEYFNKIIDGYTLFGYQFLPRLTYYPHPNVRLDLGGYFKKDFGNNEFSEIAPSFTFTYHKNNFSLVFGSLQGNINHRLIDPLYDFERVLNNRIENGTQLLWDTKKIYADIWVDWEKMIYRSSPFQEKIAGGLNLIIKPIVNENFKLEIPIQATVFHKGGQIDTINAPIFTFLNGAVGIEAKRSLSKDWNRSIRASAYYVLHSDISPETQSLYERGNGFLASIDYRNPFVDILASYWSGHQFISSRGGKLYQSVSDRTSTPGYKEKNRNLLFIRIFKDFKIMNNLYISARVEPSFDLHSSKLDYSYGLFINYKKDFLLYSPK